MKREKQKKHESLTGAADPVVQWYSPKEVAQFSIAAELGL